MTETWQSKMASKELCDRVKTCFGAWRTVTPYLQAPEQASLQGQDHWTYETGMPRAQSSVPLPKTFHFANVHQILACRTPANTVEVINPTNIDSEQWVSVAIGQNIFQVYELEQECRLLEKSVDGQFKIINKNQVGQAREWASYCNMAEEFIFATGGHGYSGLNSSVERYNIAQDVWEPMSQQMNVARENHSSCILGNTIYVLFGETVGNQCINSVEKLDLRNLQAGWELIFLPPTSLPPRTEAIVTALDSSQILIMGGEFNGTELSDILVFKTKDHSVEKKKDAPFPLQVALGPPVNVRPGLFLAMACKADDLILMEYRNGSIRCLHTCD